MSQIILPDNDEDYLEWQEAIDSMLYSGEFRFAHDTLTGILDNIEEYENITENQKRAVVNIFNSVEER